MFLPRKLVRNLIRKLSKYSLDLQLATFMNSVTLPGFLKKAVLAVCVLTLLCSSVPAQVPIEPEHDRLLNGLRVLIWPRPGDQEVLLKLRVHSGAAFDLEGQSRQHGHARRHSLP